MLAGPGDARELKNTGTLDMSQQDSNGTDIADYSAGMNKLIGEELMNIEVPMETFETPRIYSGPVEVQGANQDQDTVFAAQLLNSLTKANAGGVRHSYDGDHIEQVPAE